VSLSDVFTPVVGGRISAEIVKQIVPIILSGRLQPGDRLPPERELSERFGVSRVTVRDALRVLEVMGLIEVRVGSAGGAFVTIPSPDIVGEGVWNLLVLRDLPPDQIAEARVVIELSVLPLILSRITDEEVAELRELSERSRELLEGGEYDTALSIEFHSKLASYARNEALTLMARSFAGPLSMAAVRAREQREDSQARTVAEHLALVEALEARDHGRARTVLREHLLRGREPSPDLLAATS
jgi:GntR family transcriptional regulator, transcriptional repressor for pyruvate dehydrogenase complex